MIPFGIISATFCAVCLGSSLATEGEVDTIAFLQQLVQLPQAPDVGSFELPPPPIPGQGAPSTLPMPLVLPPPPPSSLPGAPPLPPVPPSDGKPSPPELSKLSVSSGQPPSSVPMMSIPGIQSVPTFGQLPPGSNPGPPNLLSATLPPTQQPLDPGQSFANGVAATALGGTGQASSLGVGGSPAPSGVLDITTSPFFNALPPGVTPIQLDPLGHFVYAEILQMQKKAHAMGQERDELRRQLENSEYTIQDQIAQMRTRTIELDRLKSECGLKTQELQDEVDSLEAKVYAAEGISPPNKHHKSKTVISPMAGVALPIHRKPKPTPRSNAPTMPPPESPLSMGPLPAIEWTPPAPPAPPTRQPKTRTHTHKSKPKSEPKLGPLPAVVR